MVVGVAQWCYMTGTRLTKVMTIFIFLSENMFKNGAERCMKTLYRAESNKTF
jgi:hypothetical protein